MPLLPTLTQPFTHLTFPPLGSFDGQTVIVTGSNTGIGLETASHFLSLGTSHLILGVRTLPKGEKAKGTLLTRFPETTCNIEVWELNISSFTSIIAFAKRAKEKLERLDVVVLNAGLASQEWNVSPEGWEETLQVNVLGTVLLGILCLPNLEETSTEFYGRNDMEGRKPHLVFVGSDIHMDAHFPERHSPPGTILQTLNKKENWEASQRLCGSTERYAISKLLLTYCIVSLSTKVDKERIIVNMPTPGFCKSELLSREADMPLLLRGAQKVFAWSCRDGGKCVVDAAMKGVESHGEFLDHQRIAQMGDLVISEGGKKIGGRVWKEVVGVLTKADPEIGGILGMDS